MKPNTVYLVTLHHVSPSDKSVMEVLVADIADVFVVALEKGKEQLHLHACFKTREPWYGFEVVELFENVFDYIDVKPHVEFGRGTSWKAFTKYVSKEDPDAVVSNVPMSALSAAYKTSKWLQSTAEFRYCDPFILNNWQQYRFLELAHAEHARESVVVVKPQRYLTLSTTPWVNQVLSWWNSWVKDGWHFKKPQLWLHGSPNTGKTSLIMKMVEGLRVFSPDASHDKFAFQALDVTYNVIVVDEAQPLLLNKIESTYKLLLQGSDVSVSKKYSSTSHRLRWRSPVIFISNYTVDVSKLVLFYPPKLTLIYL